MSRDFKQKKALRCAAEPFLLLLVRELVDELFVTVGANEVLLVDVERNDDLTAGRAGDLKAVVLVLVVAITAVAAIAITVTVTIVAITIAIAIAIVVLVDEHLLNVAEVLVKLLTVISKITDISLDIVYLACHIVAEFDKSLDKLCFCAILLVKLKSFAKALDISGLFGKSHCFILTF